MVDTPFNQSKIIISVSIPPSYLHEVKKGLEQHVNQYLMQYSDQFHGVMLAFKNLSLVHPYGSIFNEAPFIHCKVKLDALLFQPKKGMKLKGKVNKVGINHVGLLVCGVFNASISKDQMPNDYNYDPSTESWIAGNLTIGMDTTLEFEVLRIYEARGVISIAGTLFQKSLGDKLEKGASPSIPSIGKRKRKKDKLGNSEKKSKKSK